MGISNCRQWVILIVVGREEVKSILQVILSTPNHLEIKADQIDGKE